MDQINKILKIGILLTGIFLGFSILFVYYIKLDQPVFFKHYYEYNIQESASDDSSYQFAPFTIQYITDISDTRQISYLVFDEQPDIIFNTASPAGFFFVNNSSAGPGTKYGRYRFCSVNLSATFLDMDKIPNDLKLSQAKIFFTNGDNMEADLGEIIFHKDKPKEQYMVMSGGSSSSDGTSSNNYSITKDITLTKIDSPYLEQLCSLIHLDIDGKDMRNINGMVYHNGDNLCINSSLKDSKDINLAFTNYDLQPKLYYKDSNETISYECIRNVGNSGYHKLNFFRILQYVK